MSPIECPKLFVEYNACLDCRFRHDYECWQGRPIKLKDVLTVDERVSILEDIRNKAPELEWNGKQWDIVQQIQSELRGWREKHAEMLLKLDKLNKKLKKAESRYG